MENVEIVESEAVAEVIDVSFYFEPPSKPESLISAGFDSSAVGAQETRVRVSVWEKEGLKGDIAAGFDFGDVYLGDGEVNVPLPSTGDGGLDVVEDACNVNSGLKFEANLGNGGLDLAKDATDVDSGLKLEANLGNGGLDLAKDATNVDSGLKFEANLGNGGLEVVEDASNVESGFKFEANLGNEGLNVINNASNVDSGAKFGVNLGNEGLDVVEDASKVESDLKFDENLGNGADCISAVLIGNGPEHKVEVDAGDVSVIGEVNGSLGSAEVGGKGCGDEDVEGSMAGNGEDDSGQKMEGSLGFEAKNGSGEEHVAAGDREGLAGNNDIPEEIKGGGNDFNGSLECADMSGKICCNEDVKDYMVVNGGDDSGQSLESANVSGKICVNEDVKDYMAGNGGDESGQKMVESRDSEAKSEREEDAAVGCKDGLAGKNDTGEEIKGGGNDFNGSLESVDMSGKECGNEDIKVYMAGNGEDSSQKMEVTRSSEVKNGSEKHGSVGDKEGMNGKNDTREEIKGQDEDFSEGNGGDGENDDVDDENVGDQDHKYLVGDFVWGKIRSHPWWPGQIYDPSDASEYAMKCRQRNRFLVAYFGDSSFAWCLPSQLKPFTENFNEMSEQSSSKSFVNAVQKALDEYGRSLEAKLTCVCKVNQHGLNRPLALNAGIKQGVHVPEGSFNALSFSEHEPTEFFAQLRQIAQANSTTSTLELKVLKSWLSVFYAAKGGFQLAAYHEPLPVEGLEDKNRNGVKDALNTNSPKEISVQGPSKEFSSAVGTGFGQESQPSLHKYPGISEENLLQRKYKNMDDLFPEETNAAEPMNAAVSAVKELASSEKPVSTSRKEKRKSVGEDDTQPEIALMSSSMKKKRGRKKKAGNLGSPKSVENDTINDTSVAEEETSKSSFSRKRKKFRVSTVKNDDDDDDDYNDKGKESTIADSPRDPFSRKRKKFRVSTVKNDDDDDDDYDDKGKEITIAYSPRERKKSKYLSPPYTCLDRKAARDDSEAESVKERRTRGAVGSLPTVKYNDETIVEELSGGDISETITCEFDVPMDKLLIEIHSAAINPMCLKKKALHRIKMFVCNFRSSIFIEGSNYKTYHNIGGKRKSIASESGVVPGEEEPSKRERKERARSNSFADKEASQILFVKQKLEAMTSMVENADGKMTAEIKAELEGEMKGLLKKIGTMG